MFHFKLYSSLKLFCELSTFTSGFPWHRMYRLNIFPQDDYQIVSLTFIKWSISSWLIWSPTIIAYQIQINTWEIYIYFWTDYFVQLICCRVLFSFCSFFFKTSLLFLIFFSFMNFWISLFSSKNNLVDVLVSF